MYNWRSLIAFICKVSSVNFVLAEPRDTPLPSILTAAAAHLQLLSASTSVKTVSPLNLPSLSLSARTSELFPKPREFAHLSHSSLEELGVQSTQRHLSVRETDRLVHELSKWLAFHLVKLPRDLPLKLSRKEVSPCLSSCSSLSTCKLLWVFSPSPAPSLYCSLSWALWDYLPHTLDALSCSSGKLKLIQTPLHRTDALNPTNINLYTNFHRGLSHSPRACDSYNSWNGNTNSYLSHPQTANKHIIYTQWNLKKCRLWPQISRLDYFPSWITIFNFLKIKVSISFTKSFNSTNTHQTLIAP